MSVDLDTGVFSQLNESRPLIQAESVHQAGVTGTGVDVAVLDSGIDSDHPDLANSIIGGICFLSPLTRCPQFPAFPAEDDFGHGTHVSGIITSNGDNNIAPKGMAPAANIFSYKVLDNTGFGDFANVLAALNDVVTNHGPEDPVQFEFVSLSLGGGLFGRQTDCDSFQTSIKAAFELLRSRGTLAFAASGNDANKAAITFPACLVSVVAVGATYDANLGPRTWTPCTDATTAPDKVVCFSNASPDRDPSLDLLGPGSETLSTWHLSPLTRNASGTSMATPHATAVAALLKQTRPDLTVQQIEDRMKRTGKLVTDDLHDADSATNETDPRIDARVALLTNDTLDFDQDGCSNQEEFGSAPNLGGLRNPLSFWDFFDTPDDANVRDQSITIGDVTRVVARFGSSGDPTIDPLSPPPPAPAYHPAFDRAPPPPGVDPTYVQAANGSVTIGDITLAVNQFGHNCVAVP